MSLIQCPLSEMKNIKLSFTDGNTTEYLSGIVGLGTQNQTVDSPNITGTLSVEDIVNKIDTMVTDSGICVMSSPTGSITFTTTHTESISTTQDFIAFSYSNANIKLQVYSNESIISYNVTRSFTMTANGQNLNIKHYFGFTGASPSSVASNYYPQFYAGIPGVYGSGLSFYKDSDTNLIYSTINTSTTTWYAPYSLVFGLFVGGITGLTKKYAVNVSPTTHGTAQADKQEAESGETVVITTTPENGYNLSFGSSGTKIIDSSGNEITPTLYTPTSFGFVMPDSDVTVTCVFISGNPYLPGGTSTPEEAGPQGEFDNHSDTIPIPTTPDINYSDSGLVRLFSPSQANIIDFGNYLWTGLLNFDNIIKAFANPMDSLISFHKVPFSVNTGSSIAVKFAGISTGVVMPPVTRQLYEIDCGSLQFPRYYGSAFDYSPYSKAKIYLPYIGEIPLNIDRLIGKTIGVKYKADCYSGTLVAYVTIDNQVYIQQAGSCLLPIPISMNNYQQLVTGGFNLLAGAVSSVPQIGAGFGSNPMTSIASTALTAVKPASDLLQSAFGKPETGSSALGGGIAGYLGVQYPYVSITRPKQSLASSFNSMYGYPLNVTDYPQSYKGFVKISDITLTDTTATIQERNEIYRLLHDGIVIYENMPPEYTDSGQNLKIVFEKFTGRQNAVNKNIMTVQEMTGTFRDYQSVINPVIRVQGDILNVINNSNMVCIPRLKRRYFIDNITTNTNNSYEITLRCDVLESFWNAFKGNLAIIERAENLYNLELNDNLFVAEQKPLFQQLRFPNGFTTTSYILALSGNNGTGD